MTVMDSSALTPLWLVLPAYNEAHNLSSLLPKVIALSAEMPHNGWHVVVVDDGSSDTTKEVANSFSDRLSLEVLEHVQNQGLGATIRDGLLYAAQRAEPGARIITMDADDTHPIELIPAMLSQIDAGADVVIASRFRSGAEVMGLSRFRQTLSVGAAILMSVVFPTKGVRDFTCGFRIYRKPVLARAFEHYQDSFINCPGFQCMADIILKLRRLTPPLCFSEVPFVLRYDRKQGSSKMKVAKTIWATLKLIALRRFGYMHWT